jgi:hypothetical protein
MQMIQRLKDLLELSPGAVLDDWFELEARMHTYVVTFDTALRVKGKLEHFPQPEWVEFTDLFGAKHSVRSQDFHRISESTPKTRVAVRAFLREREQEDNAGARPAGASP